MAFWKNKQGRYMSYISKMVEIKVFLNEIKIKIIYVYILNGNSILSKAIQHKRHILKCDRKTIQKEEKDTIITQKPKNSEIIIFMNFL